MAGFCSLSIFEKKNMRKNWVLYLTFVFLISDVFLCYRLIGQTKTMQRLLTTNQKLEISVVESERQREALWHETMAFNESLIEDALVESNTDSFPVSDSAILVLFLPPNVCGSCAQDQCEIISRNLSILNDLIIMFPSYKRREVFTWFSENNDIRLIEYEGELLKSEALKTLEKVLFFQVKNAHVTNIILSDQNNPYWTQDYINKYYYDERH